MGGPPGDPEAITSMNVRNVLEADDYLADVVSEWDTGVNVIEITHSARLVGADPSTTRPRPILEFQITASPSNPKRNVHRHFSERYSVPHKAALWNSGVSGVG